MRSVATYLCYTLAAVCLVSLFACDGGDPDTSDRGSPPAVDRYVQGDLRSRIESIQRAMPRRGSEGFTPPADAELDRWRTLVGTLIDGDTTAAASLIAEHFPSFALIRFTDTETEQTYLLLQEAPSVDKGWGVVVVNPAPARNLAIEVPHPVYDLDTHREGADAFRQTDARVLIVAGTHRCANREASPCDGTSSACGDGRYHVSDMAHAVIAPFQATHEVFAERFPEMVAINLHGNGRENCEDVFLTNGVANAAHASLQALQQALVERGVSVGVPGNSSCPLIGSTNVQGRFTNGSPQPCTEAATTATGTFIHVEQRRAFREEADAYGLLVDALNATFD